MTKDIQLIQQVRLLDPLSETDRVADVLIARGIVAAIAPQLTDIPSDATVVEGRGLILAPGLVDLYSHSGEPGREERETLSTLAQAALAGGFTRLAILPDTVPCLDNAPSLNNLKQHAPSVPHFYLWGAMTRHLEGQQMTEFADLAKAGAIAFTDGRPLENLLLLRRILEYVAPLHKPVAVVAMNEELRGEGVMREGERSIRAGLAGDPAMSESAAIAAILEVVATVGTPLHFLRVSTARGVELIAQAKAKGIPVTASTTWMHLLLDTEAVCSYNPNLRLEPPLGNPEDREALVDGVKAGIIDAIAIDHTPQTYEDKTVAFAVAPPGAIGLELALPLLWQQLVVTGQWSALELWRGLSLGAQRCLQQDPLHCAIGQPAELILFDPQQTWVADRQTLKSTSSNTYWLGKTICGRVVKQFSVSEP